MNFKKTNKRNKKNTNTTTIEGLTGIAVMTATITGTVIITKAAVNTGIHLTNTAINKAGSAAVSLKSKLANRANKKNDNDDDNDQA